MMFPLMHVREHSGSSPKSTIGGLGHCVSDQSSRAYQLLPLQLSLAQLMGSKALQKCCFVNEGQSAEASGSKQVCAVRDLRSRFLFQFYRFFYTQRHNCTFDSHIVHMMIQIARIFHLQL